MLIAYIAQTDDLLCVGFGEAMNRVTGKQQDDQD